MVYFKSLIHKIQTARTFGPNDWGVFFKAWFWLLYVDLLLRVRPFLNVQSIVDSRLVRGGVPSSREWETIQHDRQFVNLAARYHLYPMRCLRQALALKALLGKQGISTALRFGVRKGTGKLLAHAWLEYEGQSIELTNVDEFFAPLMALESQE